MSRRISTFHRLALKERVLINQQMRGLGTLNKEFQRADGMRQKLDQMTREQVPDEGEQVMATLRATAQLNHQIRAQLETATNRCDHISQELQNTRGKPLLFICKMIVFWTDTTFLKNLKLCRFEEHQVANKQ